jgi:hypothetical protein
MAKSTNKGNGHEHVTETPDVSHVKNVGVTHELSDVNVLGILKFVGGLTVMAIVVHVLMWLMFDFLNSREQAKEPAPGPMAMTKEERLPPEPRLQLAPGFGVKLGNSEWISLENREPQAEYRVLREQWEESLRTGGRDQTGKVVGMPIEDAMRKITGTLPSRVLTLSEEGPGWQAEDYGVSMPTAASSGRTTEKRAQ